MFLLCKDFLGIMDEGLGLRDYSLGCSFCAKGVVF